MSVEKQLSELLDQVLKLQDMVRGKKERRRGGRYKPKREEARRWLSELLAERAMSIVEVETAWYSEKRNRFSWALVRKVKSELKIESAHIEGAWSWRLSG